MHLSAGSQHSDLFSGEPFAGREMDAYRSFQELYEKRTERTAAAMGIVRNNAGFRKAHVAGKAPMGNNFHKSVSADSWSSLID